jgi:hypothetical protein
VSQALNLEISEGHIFLSSPSSHLNDSKVP